MRGLGGRATAQERFGRDRKAPAELSPGKVRPGAARRRVALTRQSSLFSLLLSSSSSSWLFRRRRKPPPLSPPRRSKPRRCPSAPAPAARRVSGPISLDHPRGAAVLEGGDPGPGTPLRAGRKRRHLDTPPVRSSPEPQTDGKFSRARPNNLRGIQLASLNLGGAEAAGAVPCA